MSGELIDVLVPVPLLEKFTYKLPKEFQKKNLERGIRIKVPFRNRILVGIFWDYSDTSKNNIRSYKFIKEIIDESSLLDKKLLDLADWSSRYYHYPLGEVITYFFPPSLRKGKEAKFKESIVWQVTEKGDFVDLLNLSRAPNQRKGLELLREKGDLSQHSLKAYGVSTITLKNLHKKGLVKKLSLEQLPLIALCILSTEGVAEASSIGTL